MPTSSQAVVAKVVRIQTQHRFDDVADGVEQVPHPGKGVDHEQRAPDQPDGPVEAQLQVFVGAGDTQAVEERHKDPADHRHHQQRDGDDGEVDVVVPEGRLGGKAHKGVGAEDGGEHGESHRQPGHRTPPQKKVLIGVLLAGEPQAQSQHCHQVAAAKEGPIQGVHESHEPNSFPVSVKAVSTGILGTTVPRVKPPPPGAGCTSKKGCNGMATSWERGRPARTRPGAALAISPTSIDRERRHGSPSAWLMGLPPAGWLPAASMARLPARRISGRAHPGGEPRSSGLGAVGQGLAGGTFAGTGCGRDARAPRR